MGYQSVSEMKKCPRVAVTAIAMVRNAKPTRTILTMVITQGIITKIIPKMKAGRAPRTILNPIRRVFQRSSRTSNNQIISK